MDINCFPKHTQPQRQQYLSVCDPEKSGGHIGGTNLFQLPLLIYVEYAALFAPDTQKTIIIFSKKMLIRTISLAFLFVVY